MAYRVELSARVLRDLSNLYRSINAEASPAAARWFNGLEELILLLETMPRIGFVTRGDAAVRQVIYGKKPHFYRLLYEISEEVRTVRVLRRRHGRQLPESA